MIEYIILGSVQGIFEWLPISSQGIVAIVSQFLVKNIHPLDVALFLHLGTLFSVIVYFRKEWIQILTFKNLHLLRFLVISTAITGMIGFILYDTVKNIAIGGSLLLITGFGLLLTAYFHKTKRKGELNLNNRLAIITGILQGLSVIPGMSRSAATIFGLSLGKLSPVEILKISYLMSAPVVAGMSIFLFIKNPFLVSETWPALIFSFLFGLITLEILLKFAQKIDFFKFALIFALFCFLGAALELIF